MIYTVLKLNQEQALHHFIDKPFLTVELTIWPSAFLDLQDRSTSIALGTNMLFPSMERFSADLTHQGGGLPSSQHKAFRGWQTSCPDVSGWYGGWQRFSVGSAR